jgi:hypothetical protein
MRDTNGHALLVGPEARVMLDPLYPLKGTTDSKSWLDMPKLLECASGGLYTWGTATDRKAARAARQAAKKQKQDRRCFVILSVPHGQCMSHDTPSPQHSAMPLQR